MEIGNFGHELTRQHVAMMRHDQKNNTHDDDNYLICGKKTLCFRHPKKGF